MSGRHWTAEELGERVLRYVPQHEHARSDVAALLVAVEAGQVDSKYGYGESKCRHRQITLAGGGPAEWLHVVYAEGGDVDHCYIEFAEWGGRGVWMVPPEWNDDLVAALDAEPREEAVR